MLAGSLLSADLLKLSECSQTPPHSGHTGTFSGDYIYPCTLMNVTIFLRGLTLLESVETTRVGGESGICNLKFLLHQKFCNEL